jgi:hypothetical protein
VDIMVREWQTCKNTQEITPYTMGISGITSVLTSSAGSITIVARFDTLHHYDFNRIKIFCNASETGIIPEVNPGSPNEVTIHPSGEFIQYDLAHYRDTLVLHITQNDSTGKLFQLYGISLENDDPGVIYNAIGVNSAKLGIISPLQPFRTAPEGPGSRLGGYFHWHQ